ncbi:VOC family protein [Modestobacter versicolor]|uniref:Putative enzyme related to lactoylglutathione lyase n=1 Tax=Modestobacter versicolor TaxID=429133 RepID=A0A323V358_9ACTN|nr:VOC family protein [Modestobacter versicolor]MBB3674952.1 putative enzyme related to lactoylglutathione lyase [Modestobacter versicolor]PZA19222.1 VOC family protein [Modestobacter versicolor]
MLRELATVSFYADDLAAAGRWYTELLGIEPYYSVPGYLEFRVGESEDELGLIDARYRRTPAPATPPDAVVYWDVDDLPAAIEQLVALGATAHEPLTEHGDGSGFATASVVDPFGNVLGVMVNPHHREMRAARISRTAR